jgi:tRNA(Arg) A34 adenosine deaminase TadA
VTLREVGMPEVIGISLSSLGGEAGALQWTVQAATRNGGRGQLPFAALAVLDGQVVGMGVNTAIGDLDVSAHAEVTAVRDAARRVGSLLLEHAVVYSSCEPCAICLTIAAAAGVREIVFAAAAQLVPVELNPASEATARLAAAVKEHVPVTTRADAGGLSDEQLVAPFAAYLAARGR